MAIYVKTANGADVMTYDGSFQFNSSNLLYDAINNIGIGQATLSLAGSSYTGSDLPHSIYVYGTAQIYKRNAYSILVILYPPYMDNRGYKPIINSYENGSWLGWRDFIGNTIQ